MRYLAIDYGDAKVGFAYGEDETGMAFAREAFRYSSEDQLMQEIARIVQEDFVDAFVVGYPTNLDGEKTEQTKKVDVFVERLKERFEKDVLLVDERLTSHEAQEMIKAGSTKDEDAIAAQIILQSHLDKK